MTIDFNLALQNQLTERQRRKDLATGVERIYSRKHIEQAILEVFELTGGVTRLALWANQEENYGDFVTKILMKLAPKEVQGAAQGAILEYRSNVPASPLNKPKEVEDVEEAEFTESPVEHDGDSPALS